MGNYTFFICSKILVEAGNQEQMLRKTQISNGLTNRYFPKIHVGCPWYPYSNIILEWGRLLTKRHSKGGGGGDESPLFTVESTLNLTYQPVMRQCYKPGKILSNAWLGERTSPEGRRICKVSDRGTKFREEKRVSVLYVSRCCSSAVITLSGFSDHWIIYQVYKLIE